MATVEELRKTLKQAHSNHKNFTCTCGWDGDEPMLLDYDKRGPHFACPVCKEALEQPPPTDG